jgi:mono/diheme cytochrome c family protein
MMRTLVIAAGLLVATAMPLAAQSGDVAKGQAFVRKMCTPCHAVERGEPASPAQKAPTFSSVANTPGMTTMALMAWFRTPHPSMPDFIIATKDVQDINAYIMSLKDEKK